ncbi:MAG: RagB/SusD family nutrient uptake outer membrane protein [Bacteroidetes bacterium B1(2017)]|nr:MAG: RagB/SusD family nutrient uptake outer membrane protein [Bacteroidetes bacterium B1(2017)]
MKINRIVIQAIFSTALILSIASCKKWVDYNPHEDFKQTELDYLKSESDYRTMVVSVYTPLQWLNQAIVVSEIASDNAVAGGESASDILSLQQIDDMTHNANNSTLTELWQSAYEGINRANYLHQYKNANPGGQTVSFAGKEALYGEVYFLRAYYYFHLVKFFGDVPLFVDARLGLTQSKTLKRSEKAKVYAQIESDLLAAIGVLPSVQLEKGRVTKYAAQALLGKVYLYQQKYTEAASMLENVVTSGAFSLNSDYGKIFLSSNENGSESVFEIQYSNATPYYNWGAVTRGQGNYAAQQCGVRGLNGSDSMPYAAGWSTNLPTTDLASIFETGDQRKQVTVLDIEAYKKAHPTYNISYIVAPYKNTGLYNQKYLPRKGETSGQIELNYANNYRIIRYSDVLLMAAEANVKSGSGNEAKAKDYLNLVRQRAFGNNSHDITSSGNTLYLAILNERRLELAMEGDRFFDLVRTEQAEAKITGFVKGKNEVFPIPVEEINVSGLTQNSGY